jgi:gp16 family phage-associated protein
LNSFKFVQKHTMTLAPEALQAARDRFFEHGISITEWAQEHKFDVHLVYSVLSGRSRATRGESHRIAVALGLKGAGGFQLASAAAVVLGGAVASVGVSSAERSSA